MKRFFLAIPLSACLFAACAQTLRVEPVKIQPIHVTVDVNLHDTAPAAPRAKP